MRATAVELVGGAARIVRTGHMVPLSAVESEVGDAPPHASLPGLAPPPSPAPASGAAGEAGASSAEPSVAVSSVIDIAHSWWATGGRGDGVGAAQLC